MSMIVGTEKITEDNLKQFIEAINYDDVQEITTYDVTKISDGIVKK